MPLVHKMDQHHFLVGHTGLPSRPPPPLTQMAILKAARFLPIPIILPFLAQQCVGAAVVGTGWRTERESNQQTVRPRHEVVDECIGTPPLKQLD